MKRVELCCHSKSEICGSLLSVEEIIACGKESGFVGVTDSASISVWRELIQAKTKGVDNVILGFEACVEFANGIMQTVTVLAKNSTGRDSVYRLMSSKIISDEVLFDEDNRRGLILGGDGELVFAIEAGADDETLALLAEEYDFLLIDICGNTKETNERIIAIGERLGIPVVATCKPRYSRADDRIAFDILVSKSNNSVNRCERHILSDSEMLGKVDYLSCEKAREVVFTNPSIIAKQCERFELFDSNLNYVIADGIERLRSVCLKKASEYYRTDEANIPNEIRKQFDWELSMIERTNSVHAFLLLHDLMERLELSPYEVCASGTGGNLLVSFLCGITNINPLEYGLSAQLAFGDDFNKCPNIALYVPLNKHREALEIYENMPEIGRTVAGMIVNCYTDKRAEKIIHNYESEHGVCFSDLQRTRISELLNGACYCQFPMRTQRVIIPNNAKHLALPVVGDGKDDEVLGFPIFEVKDVFSTQSIRSSDMLMVLREMEKLSGVKTYEIALDDSQTMSLFVNADNGCYGMKDFMTRNSVEMLKSVQPNCFDDLVRFVGVRNDSVWNNNLDILFSEKQVDIKSVIVFADDIYTYLQHYGIEADLCRKAGLLVQHGNVKKQREWSEMKRVMITHNVPERFVAFCEQVTALIPKFTAFEKALMMWQEGYYKTHYPKIYDDVMTMYTEGSLGNTSEGFGKAVFDAIRRREKK